MARRDFRSLAATKRYVASLKLGGRLALEGYYGANDARYKQATLAIQERLERDLKGLDEVLSAQTSPTLEEARAAMEPVLDMAHRWEEDSVAALAEAIVRRPVILPRLRLRLPKREPTILGGRDPKPKKTSGGQKKYDLAGIRRRIDEHRASHNLQSNHAALCSLLFQICHEAHDRPDLLATAHEMDLALELHLKALPRARALVRAVEDVESKKLKSLEELLRRDQKKAKQGRE